MSSSVCTVSQFVKPPALPLPNTLLLFTVQYSTVKLGIFLCFCLYTFFLSIKLILFKKICAEYVSTCVLVNCRALTIGMGIMLIMSQRREIHVLKTIHKDAYFCISSCCARCKLFFSSSCLSVLVYFLVSLCYLSIMSHCRELEPPLRNSGSIQENMWN